MRWKLQNILISGLWLLDRINVAEYFEVLVHNQNKKYLIKNTKILFIFLPILILRTTNYKMIKSKQISNITFNDNYIYVNKSI